MYICGLKDRCVTIIIGFTVNSKMSMTNICTYPYHQKSLYGISPGCVMDIFRSNKYNPLKINALWGGVISLALLRVFNCYSTMNYLLLIYLPIILSILWAVKRTNDLGNKIGSCILLCGGCIVVANGVIRHFEFEGIDMPVYIEAIQQILATLIVPLAYLFFSHQSGRTLYSETSLMLFALIVLLFFPNLVVVSDEARISEVNQSVALGFRSFTFIGKGLDYYVYNISDFIITIQALLTMIRILPTYHKVRRYGLSLSRDVRLFLIWWILTVIFIIYASLNSTTGVADPVTNTICHFLFMLVVTSIFMLLGNGFDLRPVLVTEENNHILHESIELDNFVCQSKDMAQRLRILFADKHVYLQNGYSADNAIKELGTNRTYFHRMVKAEFGCSFSDLINKKRIEHIKHLLLTTDYSLMVIADMSGYSDQSYMIKVFKHHVGCTPGEWRENQKKQNRNKIN